MVEKDAVGAKVGCTKTKCYHQNNSLRGHLNIPSFLKPKSVGGGYAQLMVCILVTRTSWVLWSQVCQHPNHKWICCQKPDSSLPRLSSSRVPHPSFQVPNYTPPHKAFLSAFQNRWAPRFPSSPPVPLAWWRPGPVRQAASPVPARPRQFPPLGSTVGQGCYQSIA